MTDKTGGMPAPTRSLGQYEIVREIGRGGMATVYLARQLALERNVALKELGAFHAGSADLAERFLRESRLAGSLNHPNVVTVHEYFEYSGTPYIAMEYLPRGSLRPYVGRLDLARFAGVMEGILAGLAHAETLGIVHRDLKPENIMVTNEGRAKIADFGIAKATMATAAGAFKTATGMTVGTPAYMAPEQIRGDEVGIWTDLYSLGVMAYEHAVGKVPFHDSDVAVAILVRHVNEAIRPPRDLNPEIDPDVSSWIERLLIKDPTERTQTPAAAWDELEEIVLRLLGPRWRRAARLPENASQLDPPRPLTPAPFESHGFDTKRESSSPPADSTELETPAAATAGPMPRIATTRPGAARRRAGAVATTRPSAASRGEPKVPTVPSARKDSRRARHRSSRVAVFAVAMLAVAAVVAGGFVIGHSGASTREQGTASRTVSEGDVALSTPRAWVTSSETPQIPGLTFSDAFAREDPSTGGIMLAGTIRGAGGKLLLTPSFVSHLHRPPAANDPVQLGDAYAYRFRSLSVSGLDGPLTLLVSPTTSGVIGVGCLAPPARPGPFLAACESAAGTLRLTGAKPLALGPSRPYAASLAKAVSRLRSAGPTAGALAKASTRAEQAKLSQTLSSTHANAASTLAKADPGPDAANLNAQLIAALSGASAGYGHMSTAARKGDTGAFDGARHQTTRELAAIRKLLAALERIGYKS